MLPIFRSDKATDETLTLTPAETQEIMDGVWARGDRYMAWFAAGHLPIALALAFFHHTWLMTLSIALPATAAFLACVKWLPRRFFTRAMAGVVLQVFCGLHIYQMYGMPEQHFWFFAAFTMMIVYQDWLAMWPGALLIIAQHIVFAWLTNGGHDMRFFPEHHVGFWKLFFHFGIACVQVGIAGIWAHQMRRFTLQAAVQKRRLEEDIADRARAAAALRESEERVRLVIDTALDGVILIDDTGCITDWNPQASALFGWSRDEAIGMPVTAILFRPDDVERHREGLARVMVRADGGERIRMELTGGRRSGDTFPMELTVAAVPGSSGTAYSGFVRDLTERQRMEEQRYQLEARMQEAQHRESLGVLAGGIAHDFNNLLVGVLGNAGLARLDLSPDSPVRETIENIEQAAKRASELANQMLAYAGKGRLVVQPVRLSSIVTEMTHLIGSVVSRKAVLELYLDDQVPLVRADATQLRQVVMNLITNASDALGDRPGVVAVTTRLVDMDAATLSTFQLAESREPGRYVALEVADSGHGMDATTMSRIFDPFYTTKFTGRGLGLASVLGIVRGHGGAIRVISEPGIGTTFTILLPPADDAVSAASVASSPAVEAPVDQGMVLVVDDEPTVRESACRLLRRRGYTVVDAADGFAGIEAVRHGTMSAVLLDLTMPQLSGLETLAQIREIDPDVPVILTSGYSEDSFSVDAPNVRFLAKPFGAESLAEAVRAACRA